MTAIEVRLLELSAAMEAAADRATIYSVNSAEMNDVSEAGEYVGRADELKKAAAAIRRIVAETGATHVMTTKQSNHPLRPYYALCTCGWRGPDRFIADSAGRDGDVHIRWADQPAGRR